MPWMWFQGLKLLHYFKQFNWLFPWTQLPITSRSLWLTSSKSHHWCPSALQHPKLYFWDSGEKNETILLLRKSPARTFLFFPFFIFCKSALGYFLALIDWSASRTDIFLCIQLNLHMHWLLTPAFLSSFHPFAVGRSEKVRLGLYRKGKLIQRENWSSKKKGKKKSLCRNMTVFFFRYFQNPRKWLAGNEKQLLSQLLTTDRKNKHLEDLHECNHQPRYCFCTALCACSWNQREKIFLCYN